MRQKLRQFGPLLMVLFYIYIFPKINEFIAPYIENYINYLGVYAPIGYIAFGLLVTVFAPLGLGPLNITLQQAFGFFPSLIYFFTYTFIGLMVNFSLSKIFGSSIMYFLFPDMKGGSEIKSMKGVQYMYNKFGEIMEKGNLQSFIVFFGGGNELLAYLAGTTKLKFFKFFIICLISSLVNALLFVTRNLSYEKNNTIFFGMEALFYFFSILSLLVLFVGDYGKIKDFIDKFNYIGKDYRENVKQINRGYGKDILEEISRLKNERNKKYNELFGFNDET